MELAKQKLQVTLIPSSSSSSLLSACSGRSRRLICVHMRHIINIQAGRVAMAGAQAFEGADHGKAIAHHRLHARV